MHDFRHHERTREDYHGLMILTIIQIMTTITQLTHIALTITLLLLLIIILIISKITILIITTSGLPRPHDVRRRGHQDRMNLTI